VKKRERGRGMPSRANGHAAHRPKIRNSLQVHLATGGGGGEGHNLIYGGSRPKTGLEPGIGQKETRGKRATGTLLDCKVTGGRCHNSILAEGGSAKPKKN